MNKFNIGDKVVSSVTSNLLRKGQVYVVTYVHPQGEYYIVDNQVIASEKCMDYATSLHRFLYGIDTHE